MKNWHNKLIRLGHARSKEVNISPGFLLTGYLETYTNHELYQWDGLRRSGDPDHPYLLFQCTLDGWGQYSDSSGTYSSSCPACAFIVPMSFSRTTTACRRFTILDFLLHYDLRIRMSRRIG